MFYILSYFELDPLVTFLVENYSLFLGFLFFSASLKVLILRVHVDTLLIIELLNIGLCGN